MRVSIIGTGYVGLVTGVCMAGMGHQVICVDMNHEKVDQINRAIAPIYEDGLEELLKKNIGRGLRATTNLHASVAETDITLIAVGTPFNGATIDLSYIETVARQIGSALREKDSYHVVVVKSTVVPGTTDQVVLPILEAASEKKASVHFGVGMNPEFLSEGEAIHDFMFPDRIILGGIDERSIETQAQLYSMFEGVDVIRTNTKTAEMIKYTSNALLATMISFSNEIGNLCAALGDIDVIDVMHGVHLNKYLSPIMADGARVVPAITGFLQAGCGFGGSCLPKDVKALIAHGQNAGQPMRLLDAVIRINEQQPQQTLALLKKHFDSLTGRRVAVLGLAFKPGTNDMRESPAVPIIDDLMAQGATISAYDPYANHEARRLFHDRDITICDDLRQAIVKVDAIVLVTRWEEFKNLPELLRDVHPQPVFVDGRRMLDKRDIARYEGIGW
jgi:UDPglucose 6-dehydrogenase/GDP-mannose 6-dehydrogenase